MYTIGKGSASCAEVATVHHKDCSLLLPPDSACIWCAKCIRHGSSLQIQAKWKIKSGIRRTAPFSHTNYRYLSWSELILRLEWEHHQCQLISKQCQRLKTRIEEASERAGVAVDQMTHERLKEIMVTENSNVLQSLPPNSFQVSACIYIKFYNMNDVLYCMPW